MERAAVFVIPASFVSYHFFGRDQVSAGSGSHGVAPQSGTGTWVEFPKIPTLSPSQLRARRRVVENSYGQGTRMARGSAARMATVSAKPELSSKVLCKGTARAYVNDVPSRRTFRALHKLAGGTPSPCIDRYCGSSRVERCHCRRCCSSTSS